MAAPLKQARQPQPPHPPLNLQRQPQITPTQFSNYAPIDDFEEIALAQHIAEVEHIGNHEETVQAASIGSHYREGGGGEKWNRIDDGEE